MRRILVVCHANVSRSVIAEKILQRLLTARGLDRAVEVRSGGIAPYARDGSLMSLDAHFALRDAGIDVPRDTCATDLKRQRHLVAGADLILVMTEEQRRMLAAGFPEAAGKTVLTLRELAGEAGDIEDPAMRDEHFFRHTLAEIQRCLEAGFPRLVAGLEPAP